MIVHVHTSQVRYVRQVVGRKKSRIRPEAWRSKYVDTVWDQFSEDSPQSTISTPMRRPRGKPRRPNWTTTVYDLSKKSTSSMSSSPQAPYFSAVLSSSSYGIVLNRAATSSRQAYTSGDGGTFCIAFRTWRACPDAPIDDECPRGPQARGSEDNPCVIRPRTTSAIATPRGLEPRGSLQDGPHGEPYGRRCSRAVAQRTSLQSAIRNRKSKIGNRPRPRINGATFMALW